MSAKIFCDTEQKRTILKLVASIMAIGMAGQAANGQSTNAPSVAISSTNAPSAAASSGSSTNVTKLESVTVVGKLNAARNQIVPDLGATTYTINSAQLAAQAQGENAPFNEVLLRTPGMVQDSEANGGVHLRGEHANIQYRINDVLLPEGISGFGQELDTRFVQSMRLITGSLPAEYGFRTAGIVDIQTKSGMENGGEASMYGGSYDTLRPSFQYGGSTTNLNYFVNASYLQNDLGIENPTASAQAIHDQTYQGKAFGYLSYILDDTSRITAMASGSYGTFEIPNTPGLAAGTAPGGTDWNSFMTISNFNSSVLNENQNEQNYYGVVAYQKSAGDFNGQVAAYGRMSGVHFTPDSNGNLNNSGDLFFDGVASDVNRRIYSGGVQADASYALNDKHTVRGGLMVLQEYLTADTTTGVFPMDSFDPGTFNPVGAATNIVQNSISRATFFGVYAQDEWKIVPKVTINYGARFDLYSSSFDKENQPSPRVNIIYQPTDATTLHAGYARYFTPPPLENVPVGNVNQFDGTSNASSVTNNIGSVKAERANYFDAGISQKLAPGLQVGVDGYYKYSKNQLDDGLFGQTLILQSFNYARGRIYGVEFTETYNVGGFSTYGNVAWSVAQGEEWNSAQFLFDPVSLGYVQNHWIYLDHDQKITASCGASYLFNETRNASTRFYVDALYGTGLRTDGGGNIPGSVPPAPIPNGATVPSYYTINMGAEQIFKVGRTQFLKGRVDIVNVTDKSYVLRDGSGVGVNAAQYGMRFGIFGTLSYAF